MESIKFKNVTIYLCGANSEFYEYHKNNEYKNTSKENIIDIFNLDPLHYATILDNIDIGTFKSFNTYNWGAPITLCGSASEDIYNGIAIVNIHLGGDARGNYSEPYICREPEAVFTQNTILNIELTNGKTYSFDCDNGEAYFNFDTFDPYYINFDENVTLEQLDELKEKNEI